MRLLPGCQVQPTCFEDTASPPYDAGNQTINCGPAPPAQQNCIFVLQNPCSGTGGGGSGAGGSASSKPQVVIEAGDPNAKQNFCNQQAQEAFYQKLFPGLSRPVAASAAAYAAKSTAQDAAVHEAESWYRWEAISNLGKVAGRQLSAEVLSAVSKFSDLVAAATVVSALNNAGAARAAGKQSLYGILK